MPQFSFTSALGNIGPLCVGTLVAAGLFFYRPGWLTSMELPLFDAYLTSSSAKSQADGVVVVEIDDRSVETHGRWPWPRAKMASLVDAIAARRPEAIALTMLFPEPAEGDASLAGAMARSRVVAGFYLQGDAARESATDCGIHPLPAVLDAGFPKVPRAAGAVCIAAPLTGSLAGSGFLNMAAGRDGILRAAPLFQYFQSGMYPSLSLAATIAAAPRAELAIRHRPVSGIDMMIGGKTIQAGAGGYVWPHLRPRSEFQRIAAGDLLAAREASGLQGQIVVVGVTAAGAADVWRVPGAESYPGVFVHASAIEHLLSARPMDPYGSSRHWEFCLLLGFGSLTARLIAHPGRAGFVFVAAPAVACAASLAFALEGVFVSPIPALLSIAGNAINDAAWRAGRKRQQMKAARDFTLAALASVTALRDEETGGHLERTQATLRGLCEELRNQPRFRDFLTRETIELLVTVAPIHDIGKIGIRDDILLKPGRLSAEEMAHVREHVYLGQRVLEQARRKSGLDNPQLFELCDALVFCHHERWDGSGYPRGLKGDEIPIPARLFAVADVFDALISRRVYKPEMSYEAAAAEIAAARGTLFDPEVVDAFLVSLNRTANGVSRTAASGQ